MNDPYDWEREGALDDHETAADAWERYADTSWSTTLLDIRELGETTERP